MESRVFSQQHPVCSGLCTRTDHGEIHTGLPGPAADPGGHSRFVAVEAVARGKEWSKAGPVILPRRSHGGVAEWFRQGPAKPRTAVRFRSPPPCNPTDRVGGGAYSTPLSTRPARVD